MMKTFQAAVRSFYPKDTEREACVVIYLKESPAAHNSGKNDLGKKKVKPFFLNKNIETNNF